MHSLSRGSHQTIDLLDSESSCATLSVIADEQKNAPSDRSSVNVDRADELAWWADKLEATEEQIKTVAQKVGPLALNVESEIHRTKGIAAAGRVMGGGARPRMVELSSWREFEATVHAVTREQKERKSRTGRRFRHTVFRGNGNADWGLDTTLERSFPTERCDGTLSLRKYYRKAMTTKPAIETLTGTSWSKLPIYPTFEQSLIDNRSLWLDQQLNLVPEIYEYLVHLRHHGYPAPLLDWTESPYVAAFFAFDSPPPGATHVSIDILLRDAMSSGSGDAHLFFIGPYILTHKRHLLQRCIYSMCVSRGGSDGDFLFCEHEGGMQGALGLEGQWFKVTLPVEERVHALKNLDLMNVNAFSLFASEDSMVRTIARRECLFNEW